MSAALFEDTLVTVEGFKWCKEPKKIGLGRLTSRVLCTTHNSLLSDVDQEAANLFGFVRETTRMVKVRGRLKPRQWTVKRARISGQLLERWFLKTLVTILFAHPDELYWPSEEGLQGRVPDVWVKRAFGAAEFPGRVGLYSAAKPGVSIHSTDAVSFAPVAAAQCLKAALFEFRGLHFVLSLVPVKEGTTTGVWGPDARWWNAPLFFHQAQIEFRVGRSLSHAVDLEWG